jgi:lysophospholipase L1-like esterase
MPVPAILIVAPPPIRVPSGPIARKFTGAGERSRGLAAAFRETAADLGCPYFDAGGVTETSAVDGIHLDREQHLVLGTALADCVAPLLMANDTE